MTSRPHDNIPSDDPVPVEKTELKSGVTLTFREYDSAASEHGKFYILVGTDDTGSLRSLPLWHSALLSKIKQAKPKPGEKVRVRQLESRTSGVGRNYVDYSVKLPDRPPMIDLPRTEDDIIDEGLMHEPGNGYDE